MYGQQWLESAKEMRNPTNEQVQQYRLGVADSSSINTFFMGAQSAIVNSVKARALSQTNRLNSRKKRCKWILSLFMQKPFNLIFQYDLVATTPTSPQFTCEDCSEGKICLETYSNLVCQFSIDDLATLSNTDMRQCLSVLGSSSDCSQKNLTDIANLVVTVSFACDLFQLTFPKLSDCLIYFNRDCI